LGDYVRVRLGEVLSKSAAWVSIQPDVKYRLVTVRGRGKGLVTRTEVAGAEISGHRRLALRPSQFVVSRIDARHGSMGIVPPELDGAVVTSDFPAFDVDESRVLPKYLGWLSRSPDFVARCQAVSVGTTNRVRLNESQFLALEIHIPPLADQERTVNRLEASEALANRIRQESSDTVHAAMAVLAASEREIWPEEEVRESPTLEQVTTFLSRGRQSLQGESDHFLIKTKHVQMGKYVPTSLRLAPAVAEKVRSEATVRNHDVLIACSAAGCLGRVAYYTGDGITASTDTHVAIARGDPHKVLPQYLFRYLVSQVGQHQLRSRERGDWEREKVGFRLTELNLRDLREVPVPVPKKEEQGRIVDKLAALDQRLTALVALHQQQAIELDALLPALLVRLFPNGD